MNSLVWNNILHVRDSYFKCVDCIWQKLSTTIEGYRCYVKLSNCLQWKTCWNGGNMALQVVQDICHLMEITLAQNLHIQLAMPMAYPSCRLLHALFSRGWIIGAPIPKLPIYLGLMFRIYEVDWGSIMKGIKQEGSKNENLRIGDVNEGVQRFFV